MPHPLTPSQERELVALIKRGLKELGPVSEPLEVAKACDKALFFLRQKTAAEGLSQHAVAVSALAYAWGDQLRREVDWRWVSVGDGGVKPGLIAPDGGKCL